MEIVRRLALAAVVSSWPVAAWPSDCVVLLHGLARTAGSMNVMEQALKERGFRVANIDYPSRHHRVEKLSAMAVEAGIRRCASASDGRIHFVTHSLGGILVRHYLEHHEIGNLGRVVMLAPPNQGSQVVDHLQDVPGFGLINGPAGRQLGTAEDDVPAQLGPVTYPLGVIAGNRTINPILSQYLPNPDDGKVSVARTKVAGMTDFVVVTASHPFIMSDEEAVRQTIAFLETGAFVRESE